MTACEHSASGDPCGACGLIRDHESDRRTCSCICGMVRTANAADEVRQDYLEVLAENLASDAEVLYDAAGKTTVELTEHMLRYLPGPVYGAGDLKDCVDRLDELRRLSYSEYLRSPEWQEQRRRALLRAGGLCQGCATSDHLEVHHRKYEDRGDEPLADLTVLCAACHTAIHLVADGRRGKRRAESRRAPV